MLSHFQISVPSDVELEGADFIKEAIGFFKKLGSILAKLIQICIKFWIKNTVAIS